MSSAPLSSAPPLIDLSQPLDNDRAWAPWWARTHVKRQSHRFGAWVIRLLFGLPSRDLRDGLGWANETISLSTHGATHVDAPWHYAPTCEGKPARTIDQMPLDWFRGPGVVLDMRAHPRLHALTSDDLKRGLRRIGHALLPGEVVLIQTGNDKLWGRREYFHSGPGVSGEATRWLIDQGVRLMGIDAWGWDAPLRDQAARAKREKLADLFWEAHFVGADREYCHMERLAGLDQLPPRGFTVFAFPLKVVGGSAGPARVVAQLDP